MRFRKTLAFCISLLSVSSLLFLFPQKIYAQNCTGSVKCAPLQQDGTCGSTWRSASCNSGCNAGGVCDPECTIGVTCRGAGSGGSTDCGSAAAPGCEGSCGAGGGQCRAVSGGHSCACKPAAGNCNGPYVEECKKSCGKGADGVCYGRGGVKKVWCRYQPCKSSASDTPILTSPANGATAPGATVHLTWQPIAQWGQTCIDTNSYNNNQYMIYVGPDSNFFAQTRVAVVPGTQTSYDYTVDTAQFPPGSKVYWSIGANNGCDVIEKDSVSNFFISIGGITGTVYFDAANNCSTATGWSFGGLTASTGGASAPVQVTGKYNVPVGAGTYTLNLIGMPTGYTCSTGCAQSCPSKAGLVSPAANQNFFVTFNPLAWWQVKDSDISSMGDLISRTPNGTFFDAVGGGGYPGVPSYAGTTNMTSPNFSTTGWSANSIPVGAKTFDYQYFANQVPADTTVNTISGGVLDQATIDANTTSSYGYFWYKFDGSASGLDLTTNGPIDVGNKKVIVLVNSADFYIKSPINLTDGAGFFIVVVGKNAEGAKGNIYVDPAVGGSTADLEGFYEADSKFHTGSTSPVADLTLTVRGSVAAYDGVALERDLGDSGNLANPAELFEYAPDQIMLFPSRLGFRKINWKEVAP